MDENECKQRNEGRVVYECWWFTWFTVVWRVRQSEIKVVFFSSCSCETLMFLCSFFPGRPPPVVRWLVNGLIVDEQVEQTTGDLTENRLMWPSVQRSDLNSIFTCQAINTQLVEPRESSYVLDLHRKLIFFIVWLITFLWSFDNGWENKKRTCFRRQKLQNFLNKKKTRLLMMLSEKFELNDLSSNQMKCDF